MGPKSSATSRVQLSIHTEIEALEVVLVHRPGLEIERLTPHNKTSLLFEELPFLPKMEEEHRALCAAMESAGAEVLYVEDLIRDILESRSDVKKKLINKVCGLESQAGLASIILEEYGVDDMVSILFAGKSAFELERETGQSLAPSGTSEDFFLLRPIPNAYFTRDIAAVVGDGLVLCRMRFETRIRETLLMQTILWEHPRLREPALLYGKYPLEDRPFTIEGGDIVVLNEDAVAIGISERTRLESARRLASNLFASGRAQRVYTIPIPTNRLYMHLDTVFAVLDYGVVLAYPDVIDNIVDIKRLEPLCLEDVENPEQAIRTETEVRPFNMILRDELTTRSRRSLTVIPTGGPSSRWHAAREQASDGTNVLALGPGKVVSYRRNYRTNAAMKAEGVDVIEIEGGELVRGLGGPRCMTLPLRRTKRGSNDA